MDAPDAYTNRHHALRHALDDNDGTRGDVAGPTSVTGETPESQVPGSIPPTYETGDGAIVMESRCLACGTALSTNDAQYGGKHCGECAGKIAAAVRR